MKYLPENFKLEDVENIFGFKLSDEFNYYNEGYFYFNSYGKGEPLDIKGYDYLFDTRSQKNNDSKEGPLAIQYDYETSKVKLFMDGKEVYSKDLIDYVNILLDKYGVTQGEQSLTFEEMSFLDENDKLKVKIQFYNLSGRRESSSGKLDSKGFEYTILIKIK